MRNPLRRKTTDSREDAIAALDTISVEDRAIVELARCSVP
jgi:hypothetical protein